MKKKWSFWKGVGMMFKIIGLLVVVALLTPIGYLAWRAGQPMSMPEYGGRTYYELLADRRQAYADLAAEYQASHPNADVKVGMCFQVEVAVSLGNTLPWAALCTASELIPGLRIYGSRSQQLGCGQMGGTWLNFPSTWWNTFESLLFKDILVTAPHGPVPYCRFPAP
jgi:hypothetical protein